MAKGDGDEAGGAVGGRQDQGGLEKTLGTHQIGLEARTERVTAPSDARGAEAGAAQERIIEDGAQRGVGRQLGEQRAADDGEDGLDGKTVLGEEAVTGGPVLELRAGSGE